MEESVRELTDTELNIVSGGAAAAAGGTAAGAGHNVGIATSGGVTGINFGPSATGGGLTFSGPATDVALATG